MELESVVETDGWDRAFANLRKKFPSASEGILFCVHKLQQDSHLRLTDFRDEAKLHGITLGGRSLHSAKVLLGMEKPSVRRSKKDIAEQSNGTVQFSRSRAEATLDSAAAQDTLIDAVKRIQDAATMESQTLRKAISDAVEILQKALRA
ncbi:MAG: hypothetical protein ACYTG5_14405 [Planctomycetota bacterium]|jgi:hypothetical protein